MRLIVVILTATDNTLFKSKAHKHFQPLAGQAMLRYTLDLAEQLTPEMPIIVTDAAVAKRYEVIAGEKAHLFELDNIQNHWIALSSLNTCSNLHKSRILVLHADTPLLQLASAQRLVEQHGGGSNKITFLINEQGIITGQDKGTFIPLKPFLPFMISSELLTSPVIRILANSDTPHPDPLLIINSARQNDIIVETQETIDPNDLLNIHTRVDYALAQSIMRTRINKALMLSGVTMIDPSSAYIDSTVRIGQDTVVHPNTYIMGTSTIGEDSHIGPNAIIDSCKIGDRCRVFASVLESAVMENDTDIGPFSHLRKGAYVCEHAHIGNFGEMKNSILGPGAKMGHFSYLGDSTVGAEANIGAGTITCNFDGNEKHPTRIGDNAFIGSGTLIVAPINIGSHAKTGAGSVVTHDLPDNSLAYGVPAKLQNKEHSKVEVE